MKIRSKLMLPREHGAWVMLYVPYLLGVAVARKINPEVLLLLLSVTAFFISRESLLVWWRARVRGRKATTAGRTLIAYMAISALCGIPLVLAYNLKLLIPMALVGTALLAFNAGQASRLEERRLANELLVILGLTMTAPAAYYASAGYLDGRALWLWLLCALYFASSVFYIKLRVINLNPRKLPERRRIRINCSLYHLSLLIGLIALIITGRLHLFAIIAFGPVLIRAFWSLIKSPSQVSLVKAGIFELVYSVIFLIFTTWSFLQA